MIAYFNYINRVADAVGIDDEPEWGQRRSAVGRRPAPAYLSRACPSQHAAVAEAACDPVLVEPLEQQLGVATTHAREIAEAGERDLTRGRALGDHELARTLVGGRRDDEAVAEPHEPAFRLRGTARARGRRP